MKEKGHLWIALHLLILLFSLSSVCSKLASGYPLFSPGWLFFYGLVIIILTLYAVAWQQIIKRMPLSAAYANKAAAVVWGQIWGLLLFSEAVTPGKLLGALLIVAGIVMYARASGDKEESDTAVAENSKSKEEAGQ
ncbi:MAG: transporter [Stomatobaculum sp.]